MRKLHEKQDIELYDDTTDTAATVTATCWCDEGDWQQDSLRMHFTYYEDGFPVGELDRFANTVLEALETSPEYTDEEVYRISYDDQY